MAWNELGQTGLDMMSRMMGGGCQGGECEGSGGREEEEEEQIWPWPVWVSKFYLKIALAGQRARPVPHTASALGLSPVPSEAQDDLPDPKPPLSPIPVALEEEEGGLPANCRLSK